MKRFFLFFALVFLSVPLFAKEFIDVIYTKKGDVIRGTIVEQIPNKTVRIETPGNSYFVFNVDEIERITKEPLERESLMSRESIKRGFTGELCFGYQVGNGKFALDRMKLDLSGGYRFNKNISLTGGAGFRAYEQSIALFVPVFMKVELVAGNQALAPFMSLASGYTFDAQNSLRGVGVILNPRIGLNCNFISKMNINVAVGYELQKIPASLVYGDWLHTSYDRTVKYDQDYGAFEFSIGFNF